MISMRKNVRLKTWCVYVKGPSGKQQGYLVQAESEAQAILMVPEGEEIMSVVSGEGLLGDHEQ